VEKTFRTFLEDRGGDIFFNKLAMDNDLLVLFKATTKYCIWNYTR